MTRNALAAALLVAACSKGRSPAAEPPATRDAAAPPQPVPTVDAAAPPRAWRALRIEVADAATGALFQAFDVDAAGPVRLTLRPHIAPSEAVAPAALLAQIDAWAASPISAAPPPADASPVARFTLDADRPLAATYPAASVPPPLGDVLAQAGALINAPRVAVRCPAWDGAGAFTVDVWTQDYGVAAGPLAHTRVDGQAGTLAFTADAAGGATTATVALTAGELDTLRAALHAAELGHFTDVFGGAGEGSDLRTLALTAAGGTCARTFTNQFPPALDPIAAALAPARARLPK
ncbi:MAG: hypothetical protein JNK64_41485 [Myxococcales bacterium]|nr:hypothetical protein [Myxococcales bacterium]